MDSRIDTGNVSGLNYFHQRVATYDPNVFQNGTNDRGFQEFNQVAAPVNYAHPTNGTPNYVPYYNQQQYTAPPPPNFTSTSNNTAYIPAPTVSPLTPNSDTRLQDLNTSPSNLSTNNIPPPGTLDMPGPVNPVGDQSPYAMSSLYGVRQLQPSDPSQDNLFVSRYGYNRVGAGPRLNPDQIQNLRNDLQTNPVDDRVGNGKAGDANDLSNPSNPAANPAGAGGLNPSVRPDAVTGTSLTNTAANNALTPQQVTSTVGAQRSSLQQQLLIPPGQQSRQLAELEKRFATNHPHPTEAQSADQLNRMRQLLSKQANDAKAAKNATSADNGGNTGIAGTTGSKYGTAAAPRTSISGFHPSVGNTTPGAGGQPGLAPVVKEPSAVEAGTSDQPFVIAHLYDGIKAKGLHDLMKTAEDQMRDGQFGQSVDTYETAAEVAPNNPFVPLGRAFAELGASYYGKAESDLTRAILTEPAVLAGKYSLKGFLGEDRLQFVQKDLEGIAHSDQTARPYLLLAYIAHNTGQDDAAVTAKNLDEAARRGANPKVVELIRQAWNLKAAAK